MAKRMNPLSLLFGFILAKTTGYLTPTAKAMLKQRNELRKARTAEYQKMLDAHHAEYRGWTTTTANDVVSDPVRDQKLKLEIIRTQKLYNNVNRKRY